MNNTELTTPALIGERMASQNNRGTQYPLFAIQQDVKVWVEPGADYNERSRTEEVDELYLCGFCQAIIDDGDGLLEECEKCDEEAFDHYRIDSELAIGLSGLFFTEAAAQDHINENSYHYLNPRIYAVAAWRNPEMVAVMQMLLNAAKQEVPSFYR